MSDRCGRSSMVEQELPKLLTRVRFPSPAPKAASERRPSRAAFVHSGICIGAPFTESPVQRHM